MKKKKSPSFGKSYSPWGVANVGHNSWSHTDWRMIKGGSKNIVGEKGNPIPKGGYAVKFSVQ